MHGIIFRTVEIVPIKPNFLYNIHIRKDLLAMFRGTRCHNWLRHCAASRKVAGSINDSIIGIFH
jgi:hypothetical protein